MVILGLLLILLSVVAILSAVFVSEGSAQLLGIDLTALGIFLVGVGAGAALLWGYSLIKFGARREMKARRERKELNQLSAKLEKVEAERKKDDDERL
ncbi:MAG: hypothetical protein ABIQ15_17640 [Nocardioides sp.]